MHRVFPLDPIEARRVLHGAFSDVQHHNARVLSKGERSAARAWLARCGN